MKIAILYPLLDSIGGAELIVVGLAGELARRNHKVTIFVGYFTRDRWSNRLPPNVEIVELFHSNSDNGEDLLPLDWLAAGYKLCNMLEGYDLINPHNFPTVIWAYIAKKLSKSFPPVVWFCHEPLRILYRDVMDTHFITHKTISETVKNWNKYNTQEKLRDFMNIYRIPKDIFARFIDRYAVRTAVDLVLTNSQFTNSMVKKIYGLDGKACHIGIPFNVKNGIKMLNKENGNYILSVGRLVPLKNFRTIIKAFALLKGKNGNNNIRLKIVGTGYPEMDDLKRFTNSLGIENEVDFLGFVTNEELDKLYLNAACMIALPFEEPFGLVYLEAMARGLPVIASNEGGPREIINDGINGMLVDPDDPETVAECCSELLSNEDLAKKLGLNGFETVSDYFTLKYFVNRFEEAVKPLCKL